MLTYNCLEYLYESCGIQWGHQWQRVPANNENDKFSTSWGQVHFHVYEKVNTNFNIFNCFENCKL
jgi:hypothetical protein